MPTERILGTIYEGSQREVKSPLPCRSDTFCSAPFSLYTHKHTQTHTLSYIHSCINSYSYTHTHSYTHMCVHEALPQAEPQDGIRTRRFPRDERLPSWEPGTGHFVALSERTRAVREGGIEYPGTHMHISPLAWLLCLEVSRVCGFTVPWGREGSRGIELIVWQDGGVILGVSQLKAHTCEGIR